VKVTCSGCGKPFEAKRANAKYCGDRCRQRGRRGGKAKAPERIGLDKLLAMLDEAGVQISADQLDLTEVKAADPDDLEPAVDPPLVVRTRTDLEQAHKLETAEGQQLLIIAWRMTRLIDTGSAISSLSKEYSRLRAQLMPKAGAEKDPIDEVAKRRDKKAARAAQA
jgi:hypothetical protein